MYPNLASFKASHNSFGGILSLTTTSFNFDFSYNRISAILLFSGGIVQVGTASQHTEFLSMKVDHQNTSKVDLPVDHPNQTVVGFVKDQKNGKIFESIDTALSSLDFASAMPFLPTSDFTRFEYPAGSSLYPFSCPGFRGRDFPNLVFDVDPQMYGYHGGSDAALRLNWLAPTTDSAEYQQQFSTLFGGSTGFCRCDPPYHGIPPNCKYSCGKARFFHSKRQ